MASSAIQVNTLTPISSDIYQISDFIRDVQRNYIDVKDPTLFMGLFGYTTEMFGQLLQNSIIMSAEYANEAIPSKAKFEKNIITHALSLGINNINATPAVIDCLFMIKENDILYNSVKYNENDAYIGEYNKNLPSGAIDIEPGGYNEFILSRDYQIWIGEYEFHFDYDIVIKISLSSSGRLVYVASYDFNDVDGVEAHWNKVSDIDNPYITSPLMMNIDNQNIVLLNLPVRQVSLDVVEKKILTGNIIENKTMSFDYTGQLCDFRVISSAPDASGKMVHHILTPIYDGLYNDNIPKFCYYSYLDSNSIRLKFDQLSPGYPGINTTIRVEMQTTKGKEGNITPKKDHDFVFTYTADAVIDGDHPHPEYANIFISVKPDSDATEGADKKSIEDLKKIIPKEANSRGSITSTPDLMNFFNMLNTDSSKMYFYKKEDNLLRRIYSAYILMRDSENRIVPGNTIDIDITSIVSEEGNKNIATGSYISLEQRYPDGDEQEQLEMIGRVITDEEEIEAIENMSVSDMRNLYPYLYTNPYKVTVNLSRQISYFYLNNFDVNKLLAFSNINSKSELQFIASNCRFTRKTEETEKFPAEIGEDFGTYHLTMDLFQNTTEDILGIASSINEEPVTVGDDPHYMNNSQILPILLLEFDHDRSNVHKKAYCIGKIQAVSVEDEIIQYKLDFTLPTDDYIDRSSTSIIENELDLKLKYSLEPELGTYERRCFDPFVPDGSEEDGLEPYEPLEMYYNLKASIYMYWMEPGKDPNAAPILDEDTLTRHNLLVRQLVPVDREILKSYTLTNVYDVVNGISTLLNYSNIIDSGVQVSRDNLGSPVEILTKVPLVEYHYFHYIANKPTLIEELERRRTYILYALNILEDSIGIDFKFFNTYGPTKIYRISDIKAVGEFLPNTQIALYFSIKLSRNTDKYIIPEIQKIIRDRIENIDEIGDLHIPNLISEIQQIYNHQIIYFEFTGTDSSHTNRNNQHITQDSVIKQEGADFVPEFLNVAVSDRGEIGIYIEIV